jgi:outer membrane protein TolC
MGNVAGMKRRLIQTILVVLLVATPSSIAAAQQQAPLVLSLPDALELARRSSETVELARAGLQRSEGQLYQARSGYFPQLTGSASYTRTLASQFSSLQSDSPDTTRAPTSCDRFRADPTMPIGARVDSLDSAVECLSSVNPFAAFSDLPFGRENQYSFGLQLSQNRFTGGRPSAPSKPMVVPSGLKAGPPLP